MIRYSLTVNGVIQFKGCSRSKFSAFLDAMHYLNQYKEDLVEGDDFEFTIHGNVGGAE